MAVASIPISPGYNSQCTSAYGSNTFSAGSGNVQVVMPAGGGSCWVVWQVKDASVTPGEAFNGLRVQGNHDFQVGGGGVGVTRVANCAYKFGRVFPGDFLSAAATGNIGYVYGTGVGAGVNTVLTDASFTSTDIKNGTMLFGMVVGTDTNDAGLGAGTYRNAILNWTAYTGSDTPSAAPSDPSAVLTPNAANYSPGKNPGEQFASTGVTWTGPFGQPYLYFVWDLPGALTFAVNGTNHYQEYKGTVNDPANPNNGASGLINIPPSMLAGTYILTCRVDHSLSGKPSVYLSTPLIIPPQSHGMQWTEV